MRQLMPWEPLRSCGGRLERFVDDGVPGLKRDQDSALAFAAASEAGPVGSDREDRAGGAAKRPALEPRDVGRGGGDIGLEPYVLEGLKVSNVPVFKDKGTVIVGLDFDPSDCAVVLCVDEKSQIEPRDRTQPGLPLKKGLTATVVPVRLGLATCGIE